MAWHWELSLQMRFVLKVKWLNRPLVRICHAVVLTFFKKYPQIFKKKLEVLMQPIPKAHVFFYWMAASVAIVSTSGFLLAGLL